tara:strand:+ start:1153 stop:1374 length:222 start_codon:yes stop_codon:yes gene_type:complete
MNELETNIVIVALDHTLEYQMEALEDIVQPVFNAPNKIRSLTTNEWHEVSAISERISVMCSLKEDVNNGKYST